MGDTNPAPIEIEARFGVQTQTFESGVTTEQEFSNLKRMCARRFKLEGKTESTDFIWNNSEKSSTTVSQVTGGRSGNVRLTYRENVPVSCEVKYRIKDGFIGWPTKYSYATRFSASSEQPAPIPGYIEHTDQVTVRRKRRTKYAPVRVWNNPVITARNCLDLPPDVLGGPHPLAELAVIDLTQVWSKDSTVGMALASNDDWTKVNYEVEIELRPEALIRAGFGENSYGSRSPSYFCFKPLSDSTLCLLLLSSRTVDTLRALAEQFYDFILEMQEMIAEARRDPFCDTFLQKVSDPAATALLRARLNACCHTDPAGVDFPGCMPVNFSRKHMETIRWEEYLVSEKTDGTRFLMLFVKNTNPGGIGGAVYVTDRSFVFHRVPGTLARQLATELTTEGDSLVDGELVRNLDWQDPVFLLFDVLEWNGNNQMESIYSDRIKLIGDLCRVHDDLAPKPPKPHPVDVLPFRLAGKSVLPKSSITAVFAHIEETGAAGQRVYKEKGRSFKRHHFSDGIILCPDAPYQLKTQTNLFKWKYVDRETIDFHVEFVYPTDPSRGEVRLYCQGDREEILIKQITLDVRQNIRLQMDIRMARLGEQPAIAEFGYDPILGQWQYHLLRKDKLKANHIRIVFETMESIAENVSAAELQYRILEENDEEVAKIAQKQDSTWVERLKRLLHMKKQQKQQSHQMQQPVDAYGTGPQYDRSGPSMVNYSDAPEGGE
jgi:hypothetical protein